MSERVIRNLEFLNKLQEYKGRQQSKLILEASEDNIKALTEVIYNLLEGNIKIPEETRVELKQYKAFLRTLSDKEIPIERKKKSIFRKRHILSAVLGPILSILGTCLSKVLLS